MRNEQSLLNCLLGMSCVLFLLIPHGCRLIMMTIAALPTLYRAMYRTTVPTTLLIGHVPWLQSHLTVTTQKSDPDVIVGHEFLGVSLEVLLGRMKDLKADHWSRIGRFRRTKMNLGRPGTNLRLLYGRLVCDLASDGAKVRGSTSFFGRRRCSCALVVLI